jgi:hypothetical protein
MDQEWNESTDYTSKLCKRYNQNFANGMSPPIVYTFNQDSGPVTWCEISCDGKKARTELLQTLQLTKKNQFKQYAAYLWLKEYGGIDSLGIGGGGGGGGGGGLGVKVEKDQVDKSSSSSSSSSSSGGAVGQEWNESTDYTSKLREQCNSSTIHYAFNQETGPVTWCEVRVDGNHARTELLQTLWLSEKEQYKQYAAHLWLNKYGDGGSSNFSL